MKPAFIVGAVAIGAAAVAAVWLAETAGAGMRAGGDTIGNPNLGKRPGNVGHGTPLAASPGHELASFAQGCFWGVEERFRRVPGVVATAVGYTGGSERAPTYELVSAHRTGHVESVLVEFDPAKVSYAELLKVFWETHDPTSGDRQGPDRGHQYRSAIFTFGPAQQAAGVASRSAEEAKLKDPITTEVAPIGAFWIAEEYHQQWDEKHGARSCPAPHRPRARS